MQLLLLLHRQQRESLNATSVMVHTLSGTAHVSRTHVLSPSPENLRRTLEIGSMADVATRGGGSASGNTAAANVPGEDGPAQSAESAVCLSAGSPPSADTHWNADTGASASMTPHSHWIVADRKPWRVAVYVANGEVVYSTEKGSVIFQPSGKQSNGKPRAAVVLQDVLVVPRLANNLLSVLTLTTKPPTTIVRS